ncbi:uncharacterized protein LOC128546870 [Mercenaria mercenaria]|uniref:uncharacterized protein LOC128546870 n=1 Tax=Mercenaria mercenaria TaxID=6596 RepID=UPI00234FA84B|nr:uncharacterized protein LOC128546870 [Mercenaria mercenaria]
MLDEGEKYAVVTVSKINGEGIPTINLHDFVSGYSAIKDVANKTCYIQRSTHTMEGMKDEIYQAVKNNGEYKISQRFDCIKQEPIVKSWLPMYGRRISAFCENYDSRFFQPKDVKLTKRSTKIVSQNALWCIFCLYDGCWQ